MRTLTVVLVLLLVSFPIFAVPSNLACSSIIYKEVVTKVSNADTSTFSAFDASTNSNKTYVIWNTWIFPESSSTMLVDLNWIRDLTGDNISEIVHMLSYYEDTYLFVLDGACGKILYVEKFNTPNMGVSAIILNSSNIILIENSYKENVFYIKLLKVSLDFSQITVKEIWSREYNGYVHNVIVSGDRIYIYYYYYGGIIECLRLIDGVSLWSLKDYRCYYGLFTIIRNLIVIPHQITTVDPSTNKTYYDWYIDILDISGNLINRYYFATEEAENIGWFALRQGNNYVVLIRLEPIDDSYFDISFKIAYITETYFTIKGGNDLGIFNYQESPTLFAVKPSWKLFPVRPIIDINGDDIPEILGCTKNGLAVFDGNTGNLMFYVKYKGKNLITKTGLLDPIITPDLTNDGINDCWISINLTTFLVGLSRTCAYVIYEISEASDDQVRGMFTRCFLDVSGDNVDEIITCDFGGLNVYCIWGSYDNSPPQITNFNPRNNTVIRPGNIEFKVNCTDKSGIDVAYIAINGIKIPLQYDSSTGLYVCSCLLYEGEYSWQIIVKDKVGFETVLESMILYVDETPPSIIVNKPKNYSVVTTPNITISWRILEEHLNKTEIRIDNGTWINLYNTTEYNTTLDSGLHLVEIKATDNAGNSEMVKVFFYVDLFAPNLTILSPNNTKISETLFKLEWRASDDCKISQFEVKIDNLPWINVGSNISLVVNLWEGTHILRVKAVDIANKTTIATIIVTVQLMHWELVYIGFAWIISLIITVIIIKKRKK